MTNTREFKSFFKTVSGGEGDRCKYPTRLDTYGCGCFHDCSYCYAKSLLDFRGLWSPSTPRVASIEKIERQIKRLAPGSIVRLGGMTDCFQPIESQYKVTRATIAMLNRAGVGYLIVTKSHLVASPEYLSMLDPQLAHVQVSISSTSDDFALTYEKASKVSKRLAALKQLQSAGIDAQLRLSPYLPEKVDFSEIRSVVTPEKILVEFLRVNHWVAKWLGDKVDLLAYSVKEGGYLHLPVEEKIRHLNEIRSAFPDAELSVCEDVPEHYELWQKTVNANPADCCNLRLIGEKRA